MAMGAALGGQIGIKKESVFNTPVAVDVFTRFLSESLVPNVYTAQDMGISAGLINPLGGRRVMTALDGSGSVEFNVPSKGFGRYVQAALGSTPSAAQISTSGVYTQFHDLGAADGVSWTIQKGTPERGGTVDPLTFSGGKCVGWELTAEAKGLLKWKSDWDFAKVQPTGASALGLQSASYSADQNFGFQQVGVYTYAAYTTSSSRLTPTTPTAPGAVIRKISLKGGQPKDTEGFTANSLYKAEQLGNDWVIPAGTLTMDYDAVTWQAAYLAQTSIGIQIQAVGAIIGSSGTNTALVEFTMPTCYLEPVGAPTMTGPGVVSVDYNFVVLTDASGVSMQCYIQSTDATV